MNYNKVIMWEREVFKLFRQNLLVKISFRLFYFPHVEYEKVMFMEILDECACIFCSLEAHICTNSAT